MENEQLETQEVEEVEIKKTPDEVMDEIDKSLNKINSDQDEIQRQQAELFQKQKEWELKSNGLEQFADIIKVESYEELNTVIQQLTKIVNDIKVANSYQPKENAKQDAHSVAQQKGDTKNMIASKLASLFK